MATIDTYVVNVDPKFNVPAFKRIKTQIESLSKLANKIPVGFSVTNATFTGLKSQLRAKMSRGNYQIKIPARFDLQGRSLTELGRTIRGITITTPVQVPVQFNTNMAIASLRLALRNLTPPLRARVDLRVNPNQPPLPIPPNNNNNRNNNNGRGGQGFFGGNVTQPLGTLARYGATGSLMYGAGKMVSAPFLVEDNLFQIKALSDYNGESLDAMQDVITGITRRLPIMADELSATLLDMGRANISPEDALGKTVDPFGDVKYDIDNSQLKLVAELAAYSSESTESVYSLIKQLRFSFPDISVQELGDKLAGAADISTWSFGQMKQYTSSLGPGTIKFMEQDLDNFLSVMAMQSMLSSRPSDAGTSVKTFEQFTKNAKSKKSAAAMRKLGLRRYNEDGTSLDNFKNYLDDIAKLYKDLEDGGGKVTRSFEDFRFEGKGKNKKRVSLGKITKTFTREDVDDMLYNIGGSDANRFIKSLGLEGFKDLMAGFDKLLQDAKLDEKIAIRGQSALFKLKILFSEIETSFIEAFDLQTISAIADLFKEMGLYVRDFALYLKEIGGLSGIWDKFKDSEFMAYLQGLLEVVNKIMKVFGVDVKAMIAKNSFVGPIIPDKPEDVGYLKKFWNHMTNEERTKGLDIISNGQIIKNAETKTRDMNKQLISKSNSENTNSGNITVNVTTPPNSNPNAYGTAVVNAINKSAPKNYIDTVTSSGTGFAGEY